MNKKIVKYSFVAIFAMVLVSAIDFVASIDVAQMVADVSDLLGLIGGSTLLAVGPGVAVKGGVEVGDPNGEGKEYLDEVLNKNIVKIRPSDTPLDTLTRELNNTESAKGIEVGGWEIGTRDILDKVKTQTTAAQSVALVVNNLNMWLPGDTLVVPGVKDSDGGPLMCYVNAVNAGNITIKTKTGKNIPVLDANTEIIRLSQAASEKQAQAEVYNMNPSTRKNYCQIHMTQVEETVIHGLHDKKVNMDFSTYKEQTIWDFKRGMELTNLFGVKGITTNARNEHIFTSDGVYNQIENEIKYAATGITNANWVSITREIFDTNNGADRRLLLAGPGFIQSLASVAEYQKQLEAKNVEIILGVKVHRVETNFGELLIKPMSNLFVGPYADTAMVLDMGYVVKKVFEPLHTEELDLNLSGQRRVKAQRIIENYCLFLENLPCHFKITKQE